MFKLTWRTLLARKVRLVMSTLAIVLGIGFLTGVLVFSNGLGSTFDGITYQKGGAVLVNDPEQTLECADVARSLLGEDQVVMPGPTFMGSEDFAYFAQKKPGTYCFIGNGDTANLHHPAYDFNDEAIPHGVSYWVRLAETALAA